MGKEMTWDQKCRISALRAACASTFDLEGLVPDDDEMTNRILARAEVFENWLITDEMHGLESLAPDKRWTGEVCSMESGLPCRVWDTVEHVENDDGLLVHNGPKKTVEEDPESGVQNPLEAIGQAALNSMKAMHAPGGPLARWKAENGMGPHA